MLPTKYTATFNDTTKIVLFFLFIGEDRILYLPTKYLLCILPKCKFRSNSTPFFILILSIPPLKMKGSHQTITESCKHRIREKVDFQCFIDLYSELSFKAIKTGYVCNQSRGLYIAQKTNQPVRIFNNSGKLDVPNGGLLTQIIHKNNLDPRTQKGFLEMWKIAADLTGEVLEFEDGKTWKSRPQKSVKKKALKIEGFPPYKPNDDGRELEVSSTLEIADDKDPITEATIEYIREKINAPNFNLEDLKRCNIKPVKSNRFIKNNKLFNYSKKNFAFATVSGKNIKVKIPRAQNKNYRNIYAQNKGHRLYFYDQLPPKGKVCIISAGETDTIALNYHYNKYGIYAVCLGSEGVMIRERLIKELRQRFEYVITCFDFDDAGMKAARKANKEGLPSIKLWDYSSDTKHNDICDYLQILTPEDLLKILQFEIEVRHSIKKIDNDPFSISVPDCYKIHIDKYIGEQQVKGLLQTRALLYLKNIIRKETKLLLHSPTGTGKTTALLELALDDKYREIIGVKRTIFFVPTIPISEQVEQNIKDDFGFCPTVIKSGVVLTETNKEDDILICTYQSSHKIAELIQDSFVIIDESHTLTDWDFNDEDNRTVLEYANIGSKAMMISATPNLRLTTHISANWGFKLCKVKQNPEFAQKIQIQPVSYTGKEYELINTIQELRADKGKTIVIKKNNVKTLETFKRRLAVDGEVKEGGGADGEAKEGRGADEEMKKHVEFEIFSSKKREYREDNANYQSLMSSSRFATSISILGVTSLLDFGVSIKQEVLEYFLLGDNNANACIQCPARSRIDYETGKNKVIKEYIFKKAKPKPQKRSKKGGKEESTDGKEESKKGGKEESIDGKEDNNEQEYKPDIKHTTKVMESLYSAWNALAKNANLHEPQDPIILKKSGIKPIYKSSVTGNYEVNTIAILQLEEKRERYHQTEEQFYENLKRNFDNVEILPTLHLSTEKDEILKEERAKTLKEEKQGIQDAFQVLKQKQVNGLIEPLLETVYHSTSDQILKKYIKSNVSIKKELSIEAHEITQEIPVLLRQGFFNIHLRRYFKLKSLSINTEKLIPIIGHFSHQKSNSDFREFVNSLICGIEISLSQSHSHRCEGLSMERVKTYHHIFKEFDELQHQEVKILPIKDKMEKIIGKNRYRKFESFVKPLKELYDVSTKNRCLTPAERARRKKWIEDSGEEYNADKESKRKITVYRFSRKNPFKLLEEHGITKDEYLKGLIFDRVGKVKFRENT